MRTLWFCIFCGLFPSIAWSQALPVRSGAHDGFTRLVIDLPEPVAWILEESEQSNRFRLNFPNHLFTFDTDMVFQRIGTERLSSIRNAPQPGGLDIALSCRCDINAFLSGETMLVLDIADRTEPLTPPKVIGEKNVFSNVSLSDLPSLGPRHEPSLAEGWLKMPLDGLHTKVSFQDTDLERSIAEQIALSATRGLLSARLSDVQTQNTSANSSVETREPISQLNRAGHPGGGIEAFSKQSSSIVEGEQKIRLNTVQCIPDDQLNIESWASQGDFFDQVGRHRRQLFEEFDAPSKDVAKQLAQLYLSQGLGAEARNTLSLLEPSFQRTVLHSLAFIVDSQEVHSDVFDGQLYCDTAASMWAALAVQDGQDPEDVNTAAVLRSFERLPLTLKELLAPRLASALLGLGQLDAGADVLSRTRRSIVAPNSSLELAEAKQSLAQGHAKDAFEDLTSLARTSDQSVSPEALESAITLASDYDKPVAQDLVDLASAYATEYRGTEEATKLWRAHLRALLRNGAIDAALAEIEYARDIDAGDRSAIKTEVFQALVDRSNDVEFLLHSLTDLRASDVDVAQETLAAAAHRFLNLGLPEEALATLDLASEAPASRDMRIVRARAYLALFKPEDAEIALIGLKGDDVQALRAAARVQMGDYEYAQSSYDALGQGAAAERAAWIAGDWERVSESDSGVLASVAEMIRSTPDPSADRNNPSLAVSNDALDQSKAARETLRELLEATRINSDSDT